MRLTLTIVNTARTAPGQELSKTFEQGGTIGRDPKCDWVLLDETRAISSRHATIHLENGTFYLTDTSTNGVFVNNAPQPLGRGNGARLADRDRLRIGDLEFSVAISQEVPASAPGVAGPVIPEDIFAAPSPEPAPAAPAATPPSFAPDENVAPPVDPLSLFGGAPAAPPPKEAPPAFKPDHGAPQEQHFAPPNMIPEDWQEEEPAAPAPPPAPAAPEPAPPAQPPRREPTLPSARGPAPTPPPAPEAPAAPRPAPPRPAAPAPAGPDAAGALHTVLTGLGVPELHVPPEEADALLETIGRTLREALAGMVAALRARAAVKSEFRMSVTTIQAQENNPLKFSPNVEAAVTNMLAGPPGAYLGPEDAVREGFVDLEAHQLALMAGMQAALARVFKRFAPPALERELSEAKWIDLIPGGRKVRQWDLYVHHYEEIARSVEDDFHTLFGEEFTRVYEEQVRRLRAARRSPGGTA